MPQNLFAAVWFALMIDEKQPVVLRNNVVNQSGVVHRVLILFPVAEYGRIDESERNENNQYLRLLLSAFVSPILSKSRINASFYVIGRNERKIDLCLIMIKWRYSIHVLASVWLAQATLKKNESKSFFEFAGLVHCCSEYKSRSWSEGLLDSKRWTRSVTDFKSNQRRVHDLNLFLIK